MAILLDGKALAEKIRQDIKQRVSRLKQRPGLGVIIAGDDAASEIYVKGKEKACMDVGFSFKKIILDKRVSQMELMKVVDEMNSDPEIHGFIVQLPLPEHLNEQLVIDGILPTKDADGFSPANLGNLITGNNTILPATPKGIMRLLEEYKINLEGKHAVVLGRSNIVGKPISLLLQQKNATVTMCHSKTKNIKDITKQADIIVAAIGKPKFVTKDMVKKGAVIVDVGMNRLQDGSLVGDVDFENVSKSASYITPVPGSVGPMTIAMLLENTLECYSAVQRKS